MDIIQAIKDENLFYNFVAGDRGLQSWLPWLTALRVLYGLPVKARHHQLIRDCTGRDPEKLPAGGFDTAVILCPRHQGKSKVGAVIGSYEACLAGHEHNLAAGESGVVSIYSPTKAQSGTIKKYMSALFRSTPMLRSTLVRETKFSFELKNGIEVRIENADPRSTRSASIVCGLVDEGCFFGSEDTTIKSDTDLIRAIQPKIASVGGRLVVISSKGPMRGWCYEQSQKHWGNDYSSTLIWSPPGHGVMNPTVSQAVYDRAMQDDPVMARTELGNEWAEDVDGFVDRSIVERCVVKGRKEYWPMSGVRYSAFVDLSGGGSAKSDDAALAIAHKDGRTVVLDCLRRWKPPFAPREVIGQMATVLRRFGVNQITCDDFAIGFATEAFAFYGIGVNRSQKSKSAMLQELLTKLTSGEVQLLDDPALVTQLCALECRTTAGGRTVIDHKRGGHDDLATVVAGVASIVGTGTAIRVGALLAPDNHTETNRASFLRGKNIFVNQW